MDAVAGVSPEASNDAGTPGFIRDQYAFAAHLRDPKVSPGPTDVEDRRMEIYRDLFYNNVEGFMSDGFPVLRAITPDEVWHRRIRRFFADHRSHTPYFLKVSEEFLNWLREERGEHPDDPAFIQELAHYEWVELALSVADDPVRGDGVDPNGDLLHGVPQVSELAWNLVYQWPVHLIGPENLPEQAPEQPTYLVVYRDRQDKIGFMEVNAVTYRLLDLLEEDGSRTGQQVLEQIAEELQHPDPDVVIKAGHDILLGLREREIILGAK